MGNVGKKCAGTRGGGWGFNPGLRQHVEPGTTDGAASSLLEPPSDGVSTAAIDGALSVNGEDCPPSGGCSWMLCDITDSRSRCLTNRLSLFHWSNAIRACLSPATGLSLRCSLKAPVVRTGKRCVFGARELRENRRRLRHCDGLQAPKSHCSARAAREGRSKVRSPEVRIPVEECSS